MEVYADIIFVINFFMDFFIFLASGKFFSKKFLKKRLFFGSLFASLSYCCIIFIDYLNFIYNPVIFFVILIFSVYISFGAKNIKELLRETFVVVIVSFAVGGLAEALFYFFNISNFIGNFISLYIHNFSIKFLIFSVSLFYIILKFISLWYKKVTIKRQVFYEINIFLNNKNTIIKALVDTGNSLYEPISGKPVIISEFEAIKEILPNDFQNFFVENNYKLSDKIYDYIKTENFQIRIIPFSSIGEKSGILIGFIADKALIISENTIYLEKPIIGICNFKLSEKNEYNALLNPETLKN